jgi:DNA-binding beta-propeller fold protein YncE
MLIPAYKNSHFRLAIDHKEGTIFVCDSWHLMIQMYQSDGTYIRTINVTGNLIILFISSPNLLLGGTPGGMAVDHRTGNLAVVFSTVGTIQIFDSKGNFKSKFSEKGQNEGQLWNPTAVAFDTDSNLYIRDRAPSGADSIHVFDSKGAFIRKVPLRAGPYSVVGIGVDSTTGNIVILDESQQNNLVVMNSKFERIKTIQLEGAQFSKLTMDQSGHVVVSDHAGEIVQILNCEGEILRRLRTRRSWFLSEMTLDFYGNLLAVGSWGGIEVYG